MCEASQIAAHRLADGGYDFGEAFSGVQSLFESSDYVAGNLETPIAGEALGLSAEKWSFNAPIQFAQAVKEAGVNLVSAANNHCLDRGVDGLVQTIHNLDRCGLEHIGTYESKNDRRCFIKNIGGIRVAFLAYSYGTNAFANNLYLKKRERHMVNMFQEQELSNWFERMCYKNCTKLYSRIYRKLGRLLFPHQFSCPVYERREFSAIRLRKLRRDIKSCRQSGADYIIMCLHAGGQYNDMPTAYTKKICDRLVRFGVDAVVGTHEHVVHPCDMSLLDEGVIKTYSWGNFLGISGVEKEPYDKLAEYSVVLHIYLTKEHDKAAVCKCTFSVTKSIALGGGKIQTVLLTDLMERCTDDAGRKSLAADNLKIVNKFMGTNLTEIEVQKEYDIAFFRN